MGRKGLAMKMRRLGILIIFILALALMSPSPAFADKASVAIEAPDNVVAQGSEVTIRITVTHSANTSRHHVEWVKVWANGRELTKWDFTSSKLPEGVPFTREVKYKVEKNVEIKAEASCNVHGTKGPAILKIAIK